MDRAVPERKTQTGPIFHDLAERLRKRGIVVILSDLFDDVASIMAGLKHFRHRRHEVIILHVLDPAELDFPFRNMTMFKGLEALPDVLGDPNALREGYLKEFGAFIQEVKKGCRTHHIDYVLARTDQNLELVLSTYLASRMNRASNRRQQPVEDFSESFGMCATGSASAVVRGDSALAEPVART